MYNLQEIEKETLEFWEKSKIYAKSKKKNEKGKKFYFLQGPPYTSGRLHIGHAWNNAMKDIIMRYKRLKGFDVWDRAGYDMHGLPTANRVQKELKLKDKDEILKYGLDKFNKKCQEFSIKNKKLMDEDLIRLGVWMDFEDAYMPVTNEFISSEWALIKAASKQKRLYKGKKIMQWCADCETSLAKHELEYENVKDKSIYVKFKLKDEGGYLIVWTTTPWTIPFNLGVMVNPNLDYIKVKADNEEYIVAKELAKHLFEEVLDTKYKILKKFKGKELEGKEYLHPFADNIDYATLKKESPKIHTVLLSKDFVNLDAGTGLVHCAPGCGPEDYEVGRKNKILPFNNVNEQGIFFDAGEFNDLQAKIDDWKFTKALDDKNALIAEEKIEHEYAHCWRCNNPIIFRATEQWFLKIEDLVPKILKYNEKIKWVPNFAKKNYEDWIGNLRDNGLTRQRFWGCPMPVWECECGKIKVIGSEEELKENSINKVPENLHKPWIDKVKLKCECEKEMIRVPDVLDVWIDSGTASWNCLKYPQTKEYFDKYFPADMILEATEQTRLWFSMLQICSEIMFKKSCYKNVYAHGMIFDFQGTKMSKSLGNIISPYEVVDKFSSDILRYYICGINAGENISFNWEDVKQKQRNLIVLSNIGNYLMDLSKQKKISKIDNKKIGMEEKYILSRAESTIQKVSELFESYEIDSTIEEIEKLILDLSRVYIKLTRDKANDEKTMEIVASVISYVYIKCLKMFSTICPLICENLWQKLRKMNLVKEESVHLSEWPKPEIKLIDKKVELKFNLSMEVIEKGLAERDKVQIGLKWPLAKAVIYSKEHQPLKELNEIISRQLNVKQIELKVDHKGETKVELDTMLTQELEAEGYAREISRKVQAARKKEGLVKTDKIKLVLILENNFKKLIENQTEMIKKRTNAREILIKNEKDKDHNYEFDDKIKKENIKILFDKI
jgi:isoleucyl-tRNA synthetase